MSPDAPTAPSTDDRTSGVRVRVVAFYLPQFHPIAENNAWWGPGFTEWSNVARARPHFPRHYQPHVPRDLGFYDLRLSESREAQSELARDHNVDAFCYYHYWFNGHKLLQRPFEEVLLSGSPDLQFCVCWANDDWTRSWDGRSGTYLLKQSYSVQDDLAHIHDLLPALADPRSLRVDGKPLLLVYNTQVLPDSARTAEVWRAECQRAGIGDIQLCGVNAWVTRHAPQPGFDAVVEFQPDWGLLSTLRGGALGGRGLARPAPRLLGERVLRVYRYGDLAQASMEQPAPDYPHYPCVAPGWDNTPRRGRRALVFHDSTPAHYQRWLEHTLNAQAERPDAERLVFVNAWNEWGEGAHLEPCLRWGRAYLEATRDAVAAVR